MSVTDTTATIYPYKHPGPPPQRPTVMNCSHNRLRFVWRRFKGNNQPKRYGFQCIECGESGWKTADGRFASQWVCDRNCWEYFGEDYRLAVSFHDDLTRQRWQERQDFYNRRRQSEKERASEWWQWYNCYLQCDEWKALRQRVFARDNDRCAGCGGYAEQVHHLTYERVGYEDLSDLVSVCASCHDAVHR